MQDERPRTPALAGLSFDVADLALLQAWVNSRGLRMVVELDHIGTDGEYEEIVALYASDNRSRQWHLWCSPNDVVVQPLIGRCSRFPSVNAAIDALSQNALTSDGRFTRAAPHRTDRRQAISTSSKAPSRGRRSTNEPRR